MTQNKTVLEILDDIPFRENQPEIERLIERLTHAYSNTASVRRLIGSQGIAVTDITWKQPVSDIWWELARKAHKLGKLRALVSHSLTDTTIAGFHPDLRKLLAQVPKTLAPQASPTPASGSGSSGAQINIGVMNVHGGIGIQNGGNHTPPDSPTTSSVKVSRPQAPSDEEAPRTLTWIQLSDLHMTSPPEAQVWPSIKAALWRELARPPVDDLKPDLVLLTGDLAWSGLPEQYEQVTGFLKELRDRIGDEVPVFAVPGNRDLTPPDEDTAMGLMWLESDELYKRKGPTTIWGNDNNRATRTLRGLFKGYQAFVEDNLRLGLTGIRYGRMPGDIRASLKIKGFRLGLVGLNSAWRWGEDPTMSAIVEPYQLNALMEGEEGELSGFISRHHLCLLLQHHPPHRLFEEELWRGTLGGRFPMVLCGHRQDGDPKRERYNREDDLVVLQAPGMLGCREWSGRDESRPLGMFWGRAEAQRGEVSVTLWERKLNQNLNPWEMVHPERLRYRERQGLKLRPRATGDRIPPDEDEDPEPEHEEAHRKALHKWEERYLDGRILAWRKGKHDQLLALNQDNRNVRSQLYVSLKGTVGAEHPDIPPGTEPLIRHLKIQRQAQSAEMFLEAALSEAGAGSVKIEGEAGMGKTVLLEHVAYILALIHRSEEAPPHHLELDGLSDGKPLLPVPILFKASQLALHLDKDEGHCPDLTAFLDTLVDEIKGGTERTLSHDQIIAGLEAGRYIVLVDSLDEVPTREMRDKVVQCLESVVGRQTWGSRLVLTTRPIEYTGVSFDGDWHQVRISPLDQDTSGKLIARWCEANERDESFRAEMASAIRMSSDKHGRASFIENPLLLTSAMLVYVTRNKRLPRDTAELYEEMIQILCKSPREGLDPNDRREVLELICHTIQCKGKGGTHLDLDVLAYELEEWRPLDFPKVNDRRDMLLRLSENTGLLKMVRQNKDEPVQVKLWHRSFQEFLCACWLTATGASLQDTVDALFRHNDEPEPIFLRDGWWDVLRFLPGALGHTNTSLVREYLERLWDHYQGLDGVPKCHRPGRLLGLMANALEEYERFFQGHALAERVPEEICTQFASWPIKDRLIALEALGRLGDPRLALDRLWVDVKAGSFVIREPGVRVEVPAFKMAWRPVTVQDFGAFVNDDGYNLSKDWWHGLSHPDDTAPEQWLAQLRTPNRPVVNVSWFEAMAFCRWATEHWDNVPEGWRVVLPPEAMWEFVAAGEVGREYPWGAEEPEQGDEPHASFGVYDGDLKPNYDLNSATSVGVYPRGNQGPFVDLAGNVWEWCADAYRASNDPSWKENNSICHQGDKEAARVLRGGSWMDGSRRLRCAFRYGFGPTDRDPDLGFRVLCVSSSLDPLIP